MEVWLIAEKGPYTSWKVDMHLNELTSIPELISTIMPQNRLPNLVAIERYDVYNDAGLMQYGMLLQQRQT